MSTTFAELLQAGFSAHSQGLLDEAERAYDAAAALVPDDAQLQYLLGSLYMQTGRLPLGRTVLEGVLTKLPDHVATLSNLGLCCHELGEYARAEEYFRMALDRQPHNPDLHRKLGVSLLALQRKPDAVYHLERALALQPLLAAEVYPSLLGTLLMLNRCCEAIRHARQWRLVPGSEAIAAGHEAMAWARLGFAQHARQMVDSLDDESAELSFCKAYVADYVGDNAAAVALYRKCIEADANLASAHFNLSLNLFLEGNLQEGWSEFEWRFAKGGVLGEHGRTAPQWDGRPLDGSGVLVHSEQGIGDVLQFMRYFPLIQQRGGKVVFDSYPDVLSLLAAQDGSVTVSVDEVDLSYDWQIPLLSLGGVFSPTEQTIPANTPYLQAPAAKVAWWGERLVEYAGKFKVGLVWAGNPAHINDANRSATLNDFAVLASVPDVMFFALQKGPTAAQAECPPIGLPLLSLADEITDFTDTAAVIEQLDLVICVDTSVAHMAGALGKPVWLLLPSHCDWRWFANRDDSPWYPSMKIFRQQGWLQWPLLMRSVARELGRLVRQRPGYVSGYSALMYDAAGNLLPACLEYLPDAEKILDARLACHLVYSAWRDGLELPPRLLSALPPLWRAEYWRGRCRPELALVDYEHAWTLSHDPYAALTLLQLYADARRHGDIEPVLTALQRQNVSGYMWTYWQAQVHRYRKDFAAASELYQQVLAVNPRLAPAHVNLALCLKELKFRQEAFQHIQAAMMVQRDSDKVWYLILAYWLENGGGSIALELAEQVIRLFPSSADIQSFLAAAYGKCGRFADALQLIDSMPEVLRQRIEVMWTKASCLWMTDRFVEADAVYCAALAIYPDDTQLQMSYSMFLLSQGRWEEGWRLHEARLPGADCYQGRGIDIAPWHNEPLVDKHLLVYVEQGLGDNLQFVRFVPPAANIILACHSAVISMFRRNFPAWRIIDRDNMDGVQADYAVNTLSLPSVRALGGNIGSAPYLSSDPALREFAADVYAQLPPGPRVGVIWAGNPEHSHDMHRSMRLSNMTSLLTENRDLVWCSFQKDAAAMQQAWLDEELLPFDAVIHAQNLEQTAALLDQIDLLISVDSAMAHLAAAMGKPVWLLNSKFTDWRWGCEGDTTPWYPSMRIFRQSRTGDWDGVIERVNVALSLWKHEYNEVLT